MLKLLNNSVIHTQSRPSLWEPVPMWVSSEPYFDRAPFADEAEADLACEDFYAHGKAVAVDGKRVDPRSTLVQEGDDWFLCPYGEDE